MNKYVYGCKTANATGVGAQNHLGGRNQLCPKNFATNY